MNQHLDKILICKESMNSKWFAGSTTDTQKLKNIHEQLFKDIKSSTLIRVGSGGKTFAIVECISVKVTFLLFTFQMLRPIHCWVLLWHFPLCDLFCCFFLFHQEMMWSRSRNFSFQFIYLICVTDSIHNQIHCVEI